MGLWLHIREIKQPDDDKALQQIIDFGYDWWGRDTGYTREEVEEYYMRSCEPMKSELFERKKNWVKDDAWCANFCIARLPLTYGAFTKDGELAGSFQIAMANDIMTRPDIYPWVVNVFTIDRFRGQGACRAMMKGLSQIMASYGDNMRELFLHTTHTGLYEKFGWEYVEDLRQYSADGVHVEKLYRFSI